MAPGGGSGGDVVRSVPMPSLFRRWSRQNLVKVRCGVGEAERKPGWLLLAGASGAFGSSPPDGKQWVWGRGVALERCLDMTDPRCVAHLRGEIGAGAGCHQFIVTTQYRKESFFLTED